MVQGIYGVIWCDAYGVANKIYDIRYMRYGAADVSKDVGCTAARDQIKARRQ